MQRADVNGTPGRSRCVEPRTPPGPAASPAYLIPATNEIIQEFADLLAVVANAAADNHISPEEAKKIRARWEELKVATECFVHCCEEGNFQRLKERPPTIHHGEG